MTVAIERTKALYSRCFDDLVDYQEHLIVQRKHYTSIQLSVFLYVILGSFLIYSNYHIPIPVEHGLLSSLFLFCGFVFSVGLFNVNFFIQRKWQLGVNSTLKQLQAVLGSEDRYTYSIDSGLLETTLLATFFGIFCFSLSGWLISYLEAGFLAIGSMIILFLFIKRRLSDGKVESQINEVRLADVLEDVEKLEAAWAAQRTLIKRMSFVNESLNLIRKTMLVSFMVYPAILIADVFSKDANLSINLVDSYALLSITVFHVVILSMWNYDIVETQSNAKKIYANGISLANAYPALPPLWQNMAAFTSENYVVWHMNNLYLFPLVLSQAIGVTLVWSSSWGADIKVPISFGICGIGLVVGGIIIRKSLVRT